MKRLTVRDRELWFGVHRRVGPVLFDPSSQRGLPSDQIRIFKLNERAAGTFLKAMFKTGLVSADDDELIQSQEDIDAYVNAQLGRRVTHCFKCKNHLDSVDFSICNKCRWIQCRCDACGCSYAGDPLS
jgi:hypothetical protein